MSPIPDQSHATFLLAMIKHTPGKPDLTSLSAALNLKPAATSMRITRLKKKMTDPNSAVSTLDIEFMESLVRYSTGKTDLRGVAEDCGLKVGAVSMRVTRLKKKWKMEAEKERGDGWKGRERELDVKDAIEVKIE